MEKKDLCGQPNLRCGKKLPQVGWGAPELEPIDPDQDSKFNALENMKPTEHVMHMTIFLIIFHSIF